MNLTPEELLDALGPDWSQMSERERFDYGPKPTTRKKGRADRVRYLIECLAADGNGVVVWFGRAG